MKTMNWFKHEYCASFDEHMTKLINMEGSKGYGTYWYIIEMLCPQSEAKIDFNYLNNIKRKGFSLPYMMKIIKEYALFVVEGSTFWPVISYRMAPNKEEIRKQSAPPAEQRAGNDKLHSPEKTAPLQPEQNHALETVTSPNDERVQMARNNFRETRATKKNQEPLKQEHNKTFEMAEKESENTSKAEPMLRKYSPESERVFVENRTNSERTFDEQSTNTGQKTRPSCLSRVKDNRLNNCKLRNKCTRYSLTYVRAGRTDKKRERLEKNKITTAEKEKEKSSVAAATFYPSKKNSAGKIPPAVRTTHQYLACAQKSETETFAVPKSTSSPSPIRPWQELVDELHADSFWVELACQRCGYGALLQRYFKEAVEEFRKHILLYDKGEDLLRRQDVRQYFVNFTAPGKPTSNALKSYLERLDAQQPSQPDPYRFEQIFSGKRTYFGGQPIPEGAPPRPNEKAIWSQESGKWVSLYDTGLKART